MKLETTPSAVHATPSGMDLAKRVVDSLPGEFLQEKIAVNAKRFGYHANCKFEGVEVSSAYHGFVPEDEDADMMEAAPLMRALLSKIELGQALSSREMAFAHGSVLTLSLRDTQDAFCFSLASLLGHSGEPWVALSCVDLSERSSQNLEMSFQWL